MRELSLHILDLVENSIRAGATVVRVSVSADESADVLRLVVEDDGPGLDVPAERAADPFYTTKEQKRVGLGLSLFAHAAEQAGGRMALSRGELGGLKVEATMGLAHVDRRPMGDLPGTIASIVCANPRLDLRLELSCGAGRHAIDVRRLAGELNGGCDSIALAQRVLERVSACMPAVR